jgi:hypothetical protein
MEDTPDDCDSRSLDLWGGVAVKVKKINYIKTKIAGLLVLLFILYTILTPVGAVRFNSLLYVEPPRFWISYLSPVEKLENSYYSEYIMRIPADRLWFETTAPFYNAESYSGITFRVTRTFIFYTATHNYGT